MTGGDRTMEAPPTTAAAGWCCWRDAAAVGSATMCSQSSPGRACVASVRNIMTGRRPAAAAARAACGGSTTHFAAATRPFGAHATTRESAPKAVRRMGRPPDAGMTCTSSAPVSLDSFANASHAPHGENTGELHSPPAVKRRAALTLSAAPGAARRSSWCQMSPSHKKTSWPVRP